MFLSDAGAIHSTLLEAGVDLILASRLLRESIWNFGAQVMPHLGCGAGSRINLAVAVPPSCLTPAGSPVIIATDDVLYYGVRGGIKIKLN